MRKNQRPPRGLGTARGTDLNHGDSPRLIQTYRIRLQPSTVVAFLPAPSPLPLSSPAPWFRRRRAPRGPTPSKLGLTFVAAVQEYNAAPEADLSDDMGNAASDRMHAKIGQLREIIEAQPITSLSSLVDKAIVAACDCSPAFDGKGPSLVEAVCGLAGVDPENAMIL